MLNRILYYIVVKPISLLPFWVLNRVSNVLAFALQRIIKYRRDLVERNLNNSFPEKTKNELKNIENEFYKHLADIFIESLKMFSISPMAVQKRVKTTNPEVLEKYFYQRKDVILTSAHVGNWEMWACAGSFQMKHKVKGVYKPLKNKFWDQTVQKSRGKFGIDLVPVKEATSCLGNDSPSAVALMVDQSPARTKKCFWTKFLGQETAVNYGAEHMAVKFNAPVVYGHIQKIKRGFYEVTWQVISEDPKNEEKGFILEKATRIAESHIRREPHYWIWTHKRWKRERKAEEPLVVNLAEYD